MAIFSDSFTFGCPMNSASRCGRRLSSLPSSSESACGVVISDLDSLAMLPLLPYGFSSDPALIPRSDGGGP